MPAPSTIMTMVSLRSHADFVACQSSALLCFTCLFCSGIQKGRLLCFWVDGACWLELPETRRWRFNERYQLIDVTCPVWLRIENRMMAISATGGSPTRRQERWSDRQIK
jgi:hypothetical protein